MESVSEQLQKIMASRHEETQRLRQEVLSDPEISHFLQYHQAELTPEIIDRGMSKLYEFYHEKQLATNNQTTVAPGYSPQLTIRNQQIDVTYVPTEKLKAQQAAEALKKRVTLRNMPKFIRQADFDHFYTDEAHQTASRQDAFNAALRFVSDYQPGVFQKGLYLYGSFGVGKTYLLGAIANALAQQGVESTLLHFSSFAVSMKAAIRDNRTADILDSVKQAPILMIDDIGADAMSAWIRDDILGVILEYRMQQELPTFFSSNFSMDQLEEEHLAIDNQGNEEPLKAKRIMERIQFLSDETPMMGDNLRNG
ncbi:primosomal protein DnaI [uncultured Limosilactobacillus sp.]|uniref:primosomal protein DnaI n=1 Tax=uncultured Limosilactobacillus sp. TaxID=2837629 RepID=UPI0025E593AA|nr:primosomal protein DnaI [uncultured Limosilactobacillus sp.]